MKLLNLFSSNIADFTTEALHERKYKFEKKEFPLATEDITQL